MTKIIFLHGFDSSSESSKFEAIKYDKVCLDVDYRSTPYDEADRLHTAFIKEYVMAADPLEQILLVGHSLGGYWAFLKSIEFNMTTVLVNPQLFPKNPGVFDVEKYLIPEDPPARNYKSAYIEDGDEVIDVPRITAYLRKVAYVHVVTGGHHRVAFLDEMNKVIERAINTDMIG